MAITYPSDAAFACPASPTSRAADGLTKREYFAGLALQGLLAQSSEKGGSYDASFFFVAQLAVEHAEALIGALNAPLKAPQIPVEGGDETLPS